MSRSPVFVAEFADGITTRMTTFCEDDSKLDMARGIILARHAYHQRTGQRAPALAKASFERDGQTLKTYNAIDLADDVVKPKGGTPTQETKTKHEVKTDGGSLPARKAAAVPSSLRRSE